TTLVAAARRQGDLAFGNIIGSNINNALTVVGAAATVAPLATGDVGRAPMYALLGLTLLAAPVMWRGFVINRWEGGLLVCGYAAFLWVGLGG
ncbi:MAG: sodium:calcium antiporter, partial [Betaproteobacteria bacterium]